MSIATDPVRLWSAGLLLLAYALLCLPVGLAQLRRRRAARQEELELERLHGQANAQEAWLIVYASQTGTAEEIAEKTADTLRLAGLTVVLRSLSDIRPEELIRFSKTLLIVSTYGEGDPPDDAARFAGGLAAAHDAPSDAKTDAKTDATKDGPLARMHYGLLALGDRSYVNFCGFGRLLDGQLRQLGAQPMFERIEVDKRDTTALEAWRQHLIHLAGTDDLPNWSGPDFGAWKLVERRVINPGSAGAPVFHLELEPGSGQGALPAWESGDLAQVLVPGGSDQPREYSIASIPEDGRVHLLVRLHRRPDGSDGAASGFLGVHVPVGGDVRMRLRSHQRFHLAGNAARPLILIGNGTGIAGLRGHLRSRARAPGSTPVWLLFGERNARCDLHYREEIEAWQASGLLRRVDLVFSRDGGRHRYVQDCLAENGETLRAWVADGAAIYVCGSLATMANGVDEALGMLLGREGLDALAVAGRYRRDVY